MMGLMEEDQLFASFRNQLRDGLVQVKFHGKWGEPMSGNLWLLDDLETLEWRNREKIQCWGQPARARCRLRHLKSVREGRQTSNFIRTIKYLLTKEELPASDDRCLSLCYVPSLRHSTTATVNPAADAPVDHHKRSSNAPPATANSRNSSSLSVSSSPVSATSSFNRVVPITVASSTSAATDTGVEDIDLNQEEEPRDTTQLVPKRKLLFGGRSHSQSSSSSSSDATKRTTTSFQSRVTSTLSGSTKMPNSMPSFTSLSPMSSFSSASSSLVTFDIEFESATMRNVALSYFKKEAQLVETIDLFDPDECEIPRGISTLCFQLVSHPSFDLGVFVYILINMIVIALAPFLITEEGDMQQARHKGNIPVLQLALLVVMTSEQVLKCIAFEGVWPLMRRSKWDLFDFSIVVISWVSVIFYTTSTSATSGTSDDQLQQHLEASNLLFLRIFRSISLMTKWKEFHLVVQTVLHSLPMAANAVVCYLYYLFLFALLGMYLFRDALSNRCAVFMNASMLRSIGMSDTAVAAAVGPGSGVAGGGFVPTLPVRFCDPDDATSCKDNNMKCVNMQSPNNGLTGFDSFESSFLTIFLISLRSGFGAAIDGAVQVKSYLVLFYFIAIVVFVSYMIISLFVGIVRASYISVNYHAQAHRQKQQEEMHNYSLKKRKNFPSATEAFPDLVAIGWNKWQSLQEQMIEWFFNSRLFITSEEEEASAFAWSSSSSQWSLSWLEYLCNRFLRFHRDRIFFYLRPDGFWMGWITSICESFGFELFMNAIVFVNCLLFAFEYHGMPESERQLLNKLQNVLILVYSFEFVLCCAFANGLQSYLKNPWNRLDLLLLTCAYAEILASAVAHLTSFVWRAIFVLRLFRLVRPFRFVRQQKEMVTILEALFASMPSFLALVALHLLVTCVFGIMGMQLFGGKFPPTMRSNFNSFGDSLLTLFKISCGGNMWSVILTAINVTSSGSSLAASWSSFGSFAKVFLFFGSFYVVCVFLTLNYILVVLLRNFAMKEDDKKQTLSNLFQQRMLLMKRIHRFDEYRFLQEFAVLFKEETMYASLSSYHFAQRRKQLEKSMVEDITMRLLRVLPTSEFLQWNLKSPTRSTTPTAMSPSRVGGNSRGYYSRLEESPSTSQSFWPNSPPTSPTRLPFPTTSAMPKRQVRQNSREANDEEFDEPNSTGATTTDETQQLDPLPESESALTDNQSETLLAYSPRTRLVHSLEHWYNRTKWHVQVFFSGDWLTNDVSLFLFPLHSHFRIKCKQLERETDKFIFIVIILRTVLLTLQSPLYSNMLQEFTALVDLFYMAVLAFEFGIKVVSRGFLLTPKSYLSDGWNQFNMFVLTACSLLLLIPHSTMVVIFRLGRALGPVRVFNRVKMFRVIIRALQNSAKQVFYCMLLMLLFFYCFATLGMQFFGGKFALCNDPKVFSKHECEGFFVSTVTLTGTTSSSVAFLGSSASTANGVKMLMPRVWGNLVGLHFDNIFGAMRSIFVLVTKKGWLPVLNLAMDIVGEDHQPVQNASAHFALFFVAFIFVSRFYILKVFAGIIMNNFRAFNGTLLLSNHQLIWMRHKQYLMKMKPKYPLPENDFLRKLQFLVTTKFFKSFSSCAVILHTLILAIYPQQEFQTEWKAIAQTTGSSTTSAAVRKGGSIWKWHYLFTMIYMFDAVMVVVSMGWRDFVLKGFTWRTANVFTAFVMFVGPMVVDSPIILILGLSRAFDFKHIALVLDRFYSVRTLFETLLASVPLILKVTLLLGYVLFIFATFGVQLFSLTKWSYGLDANLNYHTFLSAFASFVKFAGGEDWYDTYLASSVGPPECVNNPSGNSFALRSQQNDCGYALVSDLFYNCFYVFVVLIVQNLYVATIVDTFVSNSALAENTAEENLQRLGFSAENVKSFQQVWSEFDTQAIGYIHKKHLLKLLTQLDAPLGLGDPAQQYRVASVLGLSTVEQIYKQRKQAFEEITARLAEFTFRWRLTQDDSTADFMYPPNMVSFRDLLMVLHERIAPLEGFTVQEKVDELAIRMYVQRFRMALRIQSAFRMCRVFRRFRNRRKRRKALSKAPSLLMDRSHDDDDIDDDNNSDYSVEAVGVPPHAEPVRHLQDAQLTDGKSDNCFAASPKPGQESTTTTATSPTATTTATTATTTTMLALSGGANLEVLLCTASSSSQKPSNAATTATSASSTEGFSQPPAPPRKASLPSIGSSPFSSNTAATCPLPSTTTTTTTNGGLNIKNTPSSTQLASMSSISSTTSSAPAGAVLSAEVLSLFEDDFPSFWKSTTTPNTTNSSDNHDESSSSSINASSSAHQEEQLVTKYLHDSCLP